MAIVNYKNLPSEETPLTGGASGNLNVMQENGTTHGSDTKLGYSQAFLNDHIVNISNEVDEDYRVNFLKSNNLFNLNEIESGTRLGSNGTTIPDEYATNLFTSLYIEVEPSTQYTINISGGNYSSRLCLYTSAKAFISYDDNGGTFTTPSNAKYIRFTNTIANIGNVMLFKGDSVPSTYEPYITPSIYVDGEEIYSKPVVLYSSATGSNGTITLNDNVSNYKYIEIYFDGGTSTATRLSMQKLDLSITNGASLFKWSVDSSGSVYAFIRDIKVSGTTLENFSSNPNYSSLTYTASGWNRANTNNIYVFKVLGYK